MRSVYAMMKLAAAHRDDLLAEAARARLVRLARSGRPARRSRRTASTSRPDPPRPAGDAGSGGAPELDGADRPAELAGQGGGCR
jgi:hypothetical protein